MATSSLQGLNGGPFDKEKVSLKLEMRYAKSVRIQTGFPGGLKKEWIREVNRLRHGTFIITLIQERSTSEEIRFSAKSSFDRANNGTYYYRFTRYADVSTSDSGVGFSNHEINLGSGFWHHLRTHLPLLMLKFSLCPLMSQNGYS